MPMEPRTDRVAIFASVTFTRLFVFVKVTFNGHMIRCKTKMTHDSSFAIIVATIASESSATSDYRTLIVPVSKPEACPHQHVN